MYLPGIAGNTLLGKGVQILGIDNIEIRNNCTIGENTLFTINERGDRTKRLRIGSNVYIGRDSFFSVGESITIGDYCIFGNRCSFICSDHQFEDPFIPYALSGHTSQKSIQIGANCWLGFDVCVLGNVKIGHGSVIGAKSVITKDIPPFSMVVGNPARIIKSYNLHTKKWEKNISSVNDSEFLDEKKYQEYLNNNFSTLPAYHYSASSSYGDL